MTKSQVETILTSRAVTHGSYDDNARISQALKDFFRVERGLRLDRGQQDLPADQCETLDMIAQKICRIFSGNNNEPDHFDDIAGYATLSADRARQRRLRTASAAETRDANSGSEANAPTDSGAAQPAPL